MHTNAFNFAAAQWPSLAVGALNSKPDFATDRGWEVVSTDAGKYKENAVIARAKNDHPVERSAAFGGELIESDWELVDQPSQAVQ